MKIRDIRRYVKAGAALAMAAWVFYQIVIVPAKLEKERGDLNDEKERDFALKRATFDNDYEMDILGELKKMPTQVYIVPDGSRLYSLFEDTLVYFEGPDFNEIEDRGAIEAWIAESMNILLFDQKYEWR